MATKNNQEIIEIKPVIIKTAVVRVVGDTPIIMHKWAEKAKRMILDKQMKIGKSKGHDAKNPVEDFIESMYWMDDSVKPEAMTEEGFEKAIAAGARFGFPATSFKQAAISSGYRTGVTKDMASLRGAFFIKGYGIDNLVEIKYNVPPRMREDMVRIAMGGTDIRFRGEFPEWYADLEVQYNANGQYSIDQILNLINLGGFSCGVGEWRPEKDGNNGMFHVTDLVAE